MPLWKTLYCEAMERPLAENPLENQETRKAYENAYKALVEPLRSVSDEVFFAADELLVAAVSVHGEAGFKAGFYAAVELLTKMGGK